MPRIISHNIGEAYPHYMLWRVVERQLANAGSGQSGAMYDHLAAMVFMFHAFEAYLNFIGFKIAPTIWKDERRRFQTFDARMAKIFELCDIRDANPLLRPYLTVQKLKKLRDSIAHGKVEVTDEEIVHDEDYEPPLFQPAPFAAEVTPTAAAQAFKDVFTVMQTIHLAAKGKGADLGPGDNPVVGLVSQRSGTSKLLEQQ